MLIKSKVLTLAVALTVSACVPMAPVAVGPTTLSNSSRSVALGALSANLRDPDSMLTRNLRAYRTAADDVIVCGEYNAKNAFGGYTGYAPFYVRIRSGAVAGLLADGDQEYFFPAAAACAEAASGTIELPS